MGISFEIPFDFSAWILSYSLYHNIHSLNFDRLFHSCRGGQGETYFIFRAKCEAFMEC